MRVHAETSPDAFLAKVLELKEVLSGLLKGITSFALKPEHS